MSDSDYSDDDLNYELNCYNNNKLNFNIVNINSNVNKNSNYSEFKYKMCLSIYSVNARGLVSNLDDRINLFTWMISRDVDVMCIQEWYIHHNSKNGKNVKFDNTLFHNYSIIDNPNNTKTLIIFKNELQHEKLDDIYCPNNGLDVSWLAIFCPNYILVIGSLYHSPDHDFDNIGYNIITQHMKIIENRYKDDKRKVVYCINGDFNSKHELWGSDETNQRGLTAMEWATNNNFHIVNDCIPTYVISVSHKENVLDLTLVSMELKSNIAKWNILKI